MDEKLRKLQLVEFGILLEVDRVCKENKINYFLSSGTALGAVRHQGFIPWDDDIDIGMLRKDYEQFIKIAPQCLKEEFFLQTLDSDPKFPGLFAKVRKNGTTFIENNKKGLDMHTGIYIDIFPFDFVPSNKRKRNKMIKKIKRYERVFGLKKIPYKCKDRGNSVKSKVIWVISAFVRRILHVMVSVLPDSFFVNKINFLIQKVEDKEYVSSLYDGKPVAWKYQKIALYDTILFEGRMFPCVKDKDYYLRTQFGDYMTLPPEEERVGHLPLYIDFGEK
ncbi:MAG: LicD family protein [Lachnospiraceae bacterium]|nr:LicD family protein [Lachnospiraceae bacterium]